VFAEVHGVSMFKEADRPSSRGAVQIVWANERTVALDPVAAPDVEPRQLDGPFPMVTLESLVIMKLTAFRMKDQVHLQDMVEVGLVDRSWLDRVPDPLRSRLQQILELPPNRH